MKNEKNYKELLIKLNSLLDKLYFEAETKDELERVLADIEREADDAYSMYEDEVPERADDELMNWPDTMENLGIRLGDFL